MNSVDQPVVDSSDSPVEWDGFLPKLPQVNLVVVVVDTLRADHIPAYGYSRNTMPLTGGLDWFVLDRWYAQGPWTAPTTPTLLSGLQPHHHGVTHPLEAGADLTNAPLLAPTLPTFLQGYRSLFYSGNPLLGENSGVGSNFDHAELGYRHMGDSDTTHEAEALLNWIDQDPNTPFVAYLQPVDPHWVYRPSNASAGTFIAPEDVVYGDGDQRQALKYAYAQDPNGTRDAVNAVYDETILDVDAGLSTILDGLEQRNLRSNTLVVFASDHGETIDDYHNGDFGHGASLQQELLHVGLMLLHPDLPAGHSDCLSEQTDFIPTLLRMLDQPVPEGLDGIPLQDGCRDLARTALYGAAGDQTKLSQLSVTDGSNRITYSCNDGGYVVNNILVTPQSPDFVIAHDDPVTAPLMTGLRAYAAEVLSARPDLSCKGM